MYLEHAHPATLVVLVFILLPKTSLLNVYLSALELKLMENQTGSDILYYNDDDLTLVAPLLDQLISTRSGVTSDHQCVHSLTFTNPPLHRDVTHAPRSSPQMHITFLTMSLERLLC